MFTFQSTSDLQQGIDKHLLTNEHQWHPAGVHCSFLAGDPPWEGESLLAKE